MEPYKAKKMPIEYNKNKDIFNLVELVIEKYGEYKGFLKSMNFNYEYFLENMFRLDSFYSFKIDNSKLNKENIFYIPYMNESNDVIEFQNLKKCLLIGVSDASKGSINIETLNKINKQLFLNCKKNNNTKGSGKFRNKQTYILKPGIAGSSISFIPPIHKDIIFYMNDLVSFINSNDENSLIATILTHYQFEKIHPYISGNGKIGRLLFPLQYSFYKKEPPILFISKSLENLKNTYQTLLSGEIEEDIDKFIKLILQCIIDEINENIKKIIKLNKIYNEDLNSFKTEIGGTTIYKVFPTIARKIVFTTNDLVVDCKLHINSVNKVLNKLVEKGYLIKQKKKGTNRVTFCYKKMEDIYIN